MSKADLQELGEGMANKDVSYNLIANQWDQIRSSKPVDFCIEEFCSLLRPGSRILDVGCGTGRPIGKYLIEHGFDYCGIDSSIEMIKTARDYLPNAKLVCADYLHYKTKIKYDAIICFDSVWHLAYDQQYFIFPKAASLLKEDGLILLTAGIQKGSIKGEMFGCTFNYASMGLEDLITSSKANGFEILRLEKKYSHPTTGDRDLLLVLRYKTLQIEPGAK